MTASSDDARALRRTAAILADKFPGLAFFGGVLADKAELLERGYDYAQEAARGRIILGWLAEHGVRLTTMNDRAHASSIDEAALRAGIEQLISAGPEWNREPAELLGENGDLLSTADLVAAVTILEDPGGIRNAAEVTELAGKFRRLLAVALGKD